MRDHHPLRAARRSRGVDDVGQVLRRRPFRDRRRALLALPARRQRHRDPSLRRHRLLATLAHQHHRRARIRQLVLEPRRRRLRVQRHVRSTSLEHPQHRHHHLQRRPHAQTHAHLRPHPQPPQQVRPPVRPRLHLAVGRPRALAAHRQRLRPPQRLRREPPVHRRSRHLHRLETPRPKAAVVPFPQQLLPLTLAQQNQLPEPRLWPLHHFRQHRLQAAQQPPDEGRGKAATVEIDREAEARSRHQVGLQRVVEALDELERIDLELLAELHERGLGRIVLDHQQALEQRRAARHLAPALDLRQRDVLMPQHLGGARLQLLEPGENVRARRHRQASRQRGDEKTDHRLDARQLGGTPGKRQTEDHVLVAAVARQQHPPGSLRQRGQGQPVPPGELLQAQRGRRVELAAAPPRLLSGGPGTRAGATSRLPTAG